MGKTKDSICPTVKDRKQCIYFYDCPDCPAAFSGAAYSFLPLRLSGGQSGTQRKARKGKAEGDPVRCPGVGNRPDSPEAVSAAAENIGSAGLSHHLPDFRICTCSYQELSGTFNRPAAEGAVSGVNGCCCVFCYPTSNVLDELFRNFLSAADLPHSEPAILCRLQREHGRTGGIYLYAAPAGKKGSFFKTLWIPRTFPAEQEQTLLQFLHNKTT